MIEMLKEAVKEFDIWLGFCTEKEYYHAVHGIGVGILFLYEKEHGVLPIDDRLAYVTFLERVQRKEVNL